MAHQNNKNVRLGSKVSDIVCYPPASGGGYNTAIFSIHNSGRELNIVKKGIYKIVYNDLILNGRTFTIEKSEDGGTTWTELDRAFLKGGSFTQVNAHRIFEITAGNTRIRMQLTDSYFSGKAYASFEIRKLV